MTPLEPWGLDDRAERIYRAILRSEGATVAGLASELSLPAEAVADRVARLSELRLVDVSNADVILALRPAAALRVLLLNARAELRERHKQLVDLQGAVAGYSREQLRSGRTAPRHAPVELVEDRNERYRLTKELALERPGEVLSFVHLPPGPLSRSLEEADELTIEQLRLGRKFRAIHVAADLDNPVERARVERLAAAGEQVRIVPQIPCPMLLVGDTALTPLDTGPNSVAATLLVRAPALVEMLRWLFEQTWTAGTPLLAAGHEGSGIDAALLSLLAAGAKDEAIARQLGVSLRTVRRRVAELMERLGARTRFQAGVEAGRRGLLGAPTG